MAVWIRHRVQYLGLAVVVMLSMSLVGCNVLNSESVLKDGKPAIRTEKSLDSFSTNPTSSNGPGKHQDLSTANHKKRTAARPKTSGKDVWATKYLNQTYQYNTPYTKGPKVPLFEHLTKQMAMGTMSQSQVKKTLFALKPWRDTVADITQDWQVGFVYTWEKHYTTMPTTDAGMKNLIAKDIPAQNDEADYFDLYVYYNAHAQQYTVAMLQVGMQAPKVFKIINNTK
ncbi:hypothetical protein [Alicyclobacillus kakegawensis]|uniref:hypothetical protein n=1 Tax=Alicyclobacillus kakegawensis TaxID=392012 RepID=UPI0008309B49|nr:hypothetical protein [Alicyclobacillus kakegawensis]